MYKSMNSYLMSTPFFHDKVLDLWLRMLRRETLLLLFFFSFFSFNKKSRKFFKVHLLVLDLLCTSPNFQDGFLHSPRAHLHRFVFWQTIDCNVAATLANSFLFISSPPHAILLGCINLETNDQTGHFDSGFEPEMKDNKDSNTLAVTTSTSVNILTMATVLCCSFWICFKFS